MICETVILPGVGRAIVCSPRRRKRCACGEPADLECDWKDPTHKSGTCDAPICRSCTFSPAPEKDLCPEHKVTFLAWMARRQRAALRLARQPAPSPPTEAA